MEGALSEIFGREASFKAAKQARCNEYEVVSIGDVVLGREGDVEFLGEVAQHVSVSTECFSFLSCTDCVESTAHYARWSNGPVSLQLVRTRSILGAVPFARDADGLTTLRGGRVRGGEKVAKVAVAVQTLLLKQCRDFRSCSCADIHS